MQVMTLPAEIKVSCALCYGALTNTKFANVTSVTDARAPKPNNYSAYGPTEEWEQALPPI